MSSTPDAGKATSGIAGAAAAAKHTGTHSPEAQKYIDALTVLYMEGKAEQDKIIDTHCSEKVTFDDNLMIVHTRPSMKVQFHAIAKMLHDVKFEARESEFREENGKRVLWILNHQQYGVSKKIMNFDVDTKLTLDSAGLITRHEDRWRDAKENFTFLKRFMGMTTSTIGKAIHF